MSPARTRELEPARTFAATVDSGLRRRVRHDRGLDPTRAASAVPSDGERMAGMESSAEPELGRTAVRTRTATIHRPGP